MKPLSIKEQIEVLEELLQTFDLWGMCPMLYKILKPKYGMQLREDVLEYIPSFTHHNYVTFYPTVKAVQKRVKCAYWDSPTIFGLLRRRWFIRHLIKELKKQL